LVILDEHAEAVATASKVLDPDGMVTFTVRIHATTRMHAHCSVEAIDVDHAKQLIRGLDISEVGMADWFGGDWELEESPGIEGDQIAYIEGTDDEQFENEIEVDMRDKGEPWSWEACELVKRIASLDVTTLTLDKFTDLVEHCRAMCEVEGRTHAAA